MNDFFADSRLRPIALHGADGFEGMRRAGRLAAECLDMLAPHVVPGAVSARLDDLAREFILDHGAEPACLGYRGYPKTLCISPNEVVCHGIPGDWALAEGDIVNIDVTVIVDGWHGDTARMYGVGPVAPAAVRLIDVTCEALRRGIAAVRPGAHLGDIGHAIQSLVENARCSVVRDVAGHGIGRVFHDMPIVRHVGEKGTGVRLEPGMFFTIEPMVNLGGHTVELLADGWTVVTSDRSLSAQWEHSVGVTEDGVEVFTTSAAGLVRPALQAT